MGTSKVSDVDAEAVLLTGDQASRVHGQVKLIRVNRGIWVQALLRTTLSCSCSRCLRSFDLGVRFQVEEIYSQAVDVRTGRHVESLREVDSGFEIDRYHVVDITEGIRQSSILSLPMKPLCREDCAGICARCGTNLNDAKCKCNGAPVGRTVTFFPV